MGKAVSLTLTICIVSVLLTACRVDRDEAGQDRLNVLFITIDDLRPQLGCYGDPLAKSPHIDRLAARGMLFERAYCQQALCAPSRSSFLTGRYPTTTGIYNIETHIREVMPDVVTLPQLFRKNGYESLGLYKVFHLVGFDPDGFGNLNDTASWSRPLWLPARSGYGPYGDSIFQASYQACLQKGPLGYGNIPRSLAYEAPVVADSMLNDGETALQAIRLLRELKDSAFFMAVGFYHPHLPFTAPEKYWNLYDRGELKLPANQHAPHNAPPYVMVSDKELRSYTNIPDEGEFSDSLKKDLLHGYLASISYVDAQVGLVLDELDRLGLRDKTIIVLLGDHGYQIGEHGLWCKKHTNFEMAVRAPLIISYPDQPNAGASTDRLVEFVDIYPTLAQLAGLTPLDEPEGKSLVPIIQNPESSWKDVAFSCYPRGGRLGVSMRTDQYRLTAWRNYETNSVDYELYDHALDPQENQNVANVPAYDSIKIHLIERFKQSRKAGIMPMPGSP